MTPIKGLTLCHRYPYTHSVAGNKKPANTPKDGTHNMAQKTESNAPAAKNVTGASPAETVEQAIEQLKAPAFAPLVESDDRGDSKKQELITLMVEYAKHYGLNAVNSKHLKAIVDFKGGEFKTYYNNRSASMHKTIARRATERIQGKPAK